MPDRPIPYQAPVVGTQISLTTYEEVLDVMEFRPLDRALVVAVCNVHSVMSARRSPELAHALSEADITTPDGMPLVWALRSQGHNQSRVYGPDLMRKALEVGQSRGWRHYLYGSTPETLETLRVEIARLIPEAEITGWHSPPFDDISDEDLARDVEEIKASGATIVWVGLGMPKQELWMGRARGLLPGTTLVGVGAAFDLLAGRVRQAPRWMQRIGLEWLFRLVQEPRRLWRRYVWNNPAFLFAWGSEATQRRLKRRASS